jgi:hypothetical protein
MRLIHAINLEMREFVDPPEYAIISHRWTDNEVTFQDFERWSTSSHAIPDPHEGWKKIFAAARIAQSQKLDWFWIDTVCIDKRSSAELSEAVNSMFDWYSEADECYVFLNDVQGRCDASADSLDDYVFQAEGTKSNPSSIIYKPFAFSPEEFISSEWFTRAWTLQELLAPNDVWFFDSESHYIGSKEGLSAYITTATNIPEDCLMHSEKFLEKSVAERMRWASRRYVI